MVQRWSMARLQVLRGDITRLKVDAIVNAANQRLIGGGGVDGAIHRAAGPDLLRACAALAEVRPGIRCPTGQARVTQGFGLVAKHVIHTVGPIWGQHDGHEPELLASCYLESLALATGLQLRSVAFPAISCGVYGYPPEQAAAIAVQSISKHLAGPTTIDEVTLVAFDAAMAGVLRRAVDAPQPG